jgi:phosphoribosylaminoimidazolecarboxamide formyltransferase/IMP cyclohydrolase
VRNAFGDYLLQSVDANLSIPTIDKVVSTLKPDAAMLADLEFAWRVCKHVKSNAIVIVKDGKAIGVGAGQMSRLDSAKIAVQRARTHGHSVEGAVSASDAFLPFPDTLEILHEAGIGALVQPGGSIKDAEVVSAADRMKVVMLFTGERHFRH